MRGRKFVRDATMANETTTRANGVPFGRSWLFLLAGLVLLGGAVAARYGDFPELRTALLVVGFVLTYAAVVERLRRMTWDFPDRLEASAMVSVSILGAVACLSAMDDAWTSGRVFFGGLFALALVGGILILLPALARRVALSLLVVFHLGGLVTAITVVDPPNGSAPWISQVLMARVYRPYLHLLYMSNAYHFYSPDPGTSTVLRFAVFYSDGERKWIEVPNKKDCPIGMTYQRVNALPEHSFYSNGRFPPNENDLRGVAEADRPPRGSWEEISRRRQNGAGLPWGPDKKPIPMVLDIDLNMQYQQPTEISEQQIASLARHIWHYPPAQRQGAEIKSVKVYRVKVHVLTPYQLAKGRDPFDPLQTAPYFMGEFDEKGTLLNPKDPFLYWYLPVVRVSPNFPEPGTGLPVVNVRVDPPKFNKLLDCLEMHAATPSPAERKERK
jgi:hypothetical protein